MAKVVGKANWYWPLQLLDSHYWFRKLQNDRTNHPSSPNNPDGTGSNGKKKNEDGPMGSQSERSNSRASGGGPQERTLMRRKSWGGLGLASLAAVKAHNLAKEEQQKQEHGVWGKVKKTLWKIGLLRNDKVEWQRQLAAAKIQRAWRKAKHHGEPQADSTDFAWQGTSLRKSSSSAARAFRKQSMMKHYSSLNKNFRQSRKRSDAPDTTTPPAAGNNADHFDKNRRGRNESQVGSAMRELTGQRVAFGIIVSLVLTVLFTYSEDNSTRQVTMMVLHRQTSFPKFANRSLYAARNSSVPDLYKYDFGDNRPIATFEVQDEISSGLRNREILRISVTDSTRGHKTTGWFAYRNERREQALLELLATIFIILIWLFGVTAFAGPVMILVVLPIERMVRLLGMLMLDPLGYQSTSRYQKFVAEENFLTKNTRWTKEVLKGMETSFLMSTILRIGSLMKVGFGSAGVEIIRKNLEKKQGGNVNLLTSQGTTVSCIFLFCDIRQFTDATECLQEEVFVFTNRIAAVVHSFCHSYGGSANKNIGDAFLCSWLLDDPSTAVASSNNRPSKDGLFANNNQADKVRYINSSSYFNSLPDSLRFFFLFPNYFSFIYHLSVFLLQCLLCVVKVLMALHHDDYYVETMNEAPRERLLAKLSKRSGPIVQMGFGLHAGKAVQGAIGSERKIDATYVSEAVGMAEFLESSTKKYGVNMLISDVFHRLLHSSNRYRCRIVDQIVIQDDDADEDEIYQGDIIELYTYDVNIDALWEVPVASAEGPGTDTISDTESFNERLGSRRDAIKNNLSLRGSKEGGRSGRRKVGRRMSITRLSGKSQSDNLGGASDELKLGETSGAFQQGASAVQSSTGIGDSKLKETVFQKPELVLPAGPALYNANIWRSEQMLKIRAKYSDGLFFHRFNSGLQSFYSQDWDHAKQCFQGILDDCLDDGPSKYFLEQIKKYNGRPPPKFPGYGIA